MPQARAGTPAPLANVKGAAKAVDQAREYGRHALRQKTVIETPPADRALQQRLHKYDDG